MTGPLLSVGEAAFLLGVTRRRIQWWIENGCLQPSPDVPHGKGRYYRISQDELQVAKRALEHQRKYGIHFVSPGLFETLRHGETSNTGHSSA